MSTENQPPDEGGKPPVTPTIPPGMVVLSEAEHNRLQAEARAARKAAKEREEREAADRIAKERALGEFDAALARANQAREEAEKRALALERKQAIRDVIAARGLSGERAQLLLEIVDTSAENAELAVESAIAKFPSAFAAEAPPARKSAPVGPATPPSAPQSGAGGKSLPENYLSPEEYMASPPEVRASAAFRQRVAVSQPHWPKLVSFREA